MRKIRVYMWFLEPNNSYSNEILVKGLGVQADENLFFDILCSDCKKHSLIKCSWAYIVKAQKSRKTEQNLSFKIWCKEGGGIIKPWVFDKSKKKVIKIPKLQKRVIISQVGNNILGSGKSIGDTTT